jgi:hypothetical protein
VLLLAKKALIRARVTGTLGIKGVIKGLIGREEEGVEIEAAKVAKAKAI